MIHDREGAAIQRIAERAACIIQLLPGISLTHPTPRQCEAARAALGELHRALAHYPGAPDTTMDHRHWRAIADPTRDIAAVQDGQRAMANEEVTWLDAPAP